MNKPKINYWVLPAIERNPNEPLFVRVSPLLEGSKMSDTKKRFLDHLKRFVEIEYGLPDLLVPKRYVHYIKARSTFVYLARIYTSVGYVALGKYLEKDHSTIIHNHKVANDFMQTCSEYHISCTNIEGRVKSMLCIYD